MSDLLIEEIQLKKRIRQLTYYELKLLLRQMEESEDYEICILIQKEIDERVE